MKKVKDARHVHAMLTTVTSLLDELGVMKDKFLDARVAKMVEDFKEHLPAEMVNFVFAYIKVHRLDSDFESRVVSATRDYGVEKVLEEAPRFLADTEFDLRMYYEEEEEQEEA